MGEYAPIKRSYLDENDEMHNGTFVASGQWGDGHLAYSRLDEKGERIPEEDGVYAQIRHGSKLIMVRV